MQFTEENIRYGLLTFDQPLKDHIESYAKEKLCISGLYQWARIFKGDFFFPVFPGDADKFNVLHINITPRNIPLLDQVLPMIDRNKTKLLFNVDHSTGLWMQAFQFPHQLLRALDRADYIFGVEPIMCELLSEALKREVPCIPHPVDIEQIEKRRHGDRGQRIGISMHRYVGNTVLPWFVVKDLPKGWITTAIGAQSPQFSPKIHHMYPEVQPYLKFDSLIDYVADLFAMIESYTIPSYGRLTVECAALGVPSIGCAVVGSQKKCFPELTVEQYNPVLMQKLLMRLLTEPEFYKQVARKGISECESYSLNNSKKKMLEFLNKNETKKKENR